MENTQCDAGRIEKLYTELSEEFKKAELKGRTWHAAILKLELFNVKVEKDMAEGKILCDNRGSYGIFNDYEGPWWFELNEGIRYGIQGDKTHSPITEFENAQMLQMRWDFTENNYHIQYEMHSKFGMFDFAFMNASNNDGLLTHHQIIYNVNLIGEWERYKVYDIIR